MICEYVSPEEREQIMNELDAAELSGATEDALFEIGKKLPVLPSLAMSMKITSGLQALLNSDLNLYDAVQEYGEEFLKK